MSIKRGTIERYMAKHGYGTPLPHYWLNVMEDDLDAQIASLQNLVAGGTGAWYMGVDRGQTEEDRADREKIEYNREAHIDALRDMGAL